MPTPRRLVSAFGPANYAARTSDPRRACPECEARLFEPVVSAILAFLEREGTR